MAVVLGLAFSSHIHLPRHPLIHMQSRAERDPQENAPLHNHNSTTTR